MKIKVNAGVPKDLAVNGKPLAASTEYELSDAEGSAVIRGGYASAVEVKPDVVEVEIKTPPKRKARAKRGKK